MVQVEEVESWARGLEELHARIAPRFARSEAPKLRASRQGAGIPEGASQPSQAQERMATGRTSR